MNQVEKRVTRLASREVIVYRKRVSVRGVLPEISRDKTAVAVVPEKKVSSLEGCLLQGTKLEVVEMSLKISRAAIEVHTKVPHCQQYY